MFEWKVHKPVVLHLVHLQVSSKMQACWEDYLVKSMNANQGLADDAGGGVSLIIPRHDSSKMVPGSLYRRIVEHNPLQSQFLQ